LKSKYDFKVLFFYLKLTDKFLKRFAKNQLRRFFAASLKTYLTPS